MRERSRLFLSLLLAAGAAAWGQPYGRPPALRDVGIEQKLNYQVPMDLTFKDEAGKAVRLGQYFQGKPVVLSLVYYKCPMLCNLVMNGELRSFRMVPMTLGKDFEAVTVSFDPKETPDVAAAKKVQYVNSYNRPDAGAAWHFLTGTEDQIRALAEAVGFRYAWDDKTNQWAHASGVMILTPEGRIARYLYGIEYAKTDMRLALLEASEHRIMSRTDQILLFCYHFDPASGKYTFAIVNILRVAGTATVLGIALFMFISLRRERHGEELHPL